MRKLLDYFQKMMMATTFAEAGEWQTARQLLPRRGSAIKITEYDRLFAAVTFAEAGLHEEARRVVESRLRPPHFPDFLESLGLQGIRVQFLVLPAGSLSAPDPCEVGSE